MTNKEKIEEFMSQIDESWSDLKKLRYICIKLCEMYEYDAKYKYGTKDEQIEYMNRIYQRIFSQSEEEKNISMDYENEHKICADLFEIYERLVRRVGIPEEKCESMGNGIFYSDDNGIRYYIHPVEELFCVKTKASPAGFKAAYPPNAIDKDTAIMEIDKELGFIDERGYIGDAEKIVERQNPKNTELLIKSVEDVLQKGARYLNSVIGVQIKNVELHRFYRDLLQTGFPNTVCIVKPLSAPELEDIQYVILVKSKEKENECISFLYDKMKRMFERKTIEEIRIMIQELGLEDLGKHNVGCIDNLCDVGR